VYLISNYTTFSAAWLPGLRAWVEAGGVLVIGARTATKDLDNNVVTAPAPGLLRELTGVTIAESGRQNRPDLRPLVIGMGEARVPTSLWYEQLAPGEDVEVVGTWESRHLKGTAAVTRRRQGRGAVYYVGTYFSEELLAALGTRLALSGELPVPERLPAGIERVVRENSTHRFTFLINHGEGPATVESPPPGLELTEGSPVAGPLEIAANGVCIVQTPVASS
jgi:beta-galactosidase